MLDRSNIEINNPIYLRDYDEDEPTTHDGEGDAFTFNNDKSVRIEMSNSLMNSLALRKVHIASNGVHLLLYLNIIMHVTDILDS